MSENTMRNAPAPVQVMASLETRWQSQQLFLREAMARLKMTRDTFARRINTPRRTLDKWLLPGTSRDHRIMDGVVWQFVREIVDREAKTEAGKVEAESGPSESSGQVNSQHLKNKQHLKKDGQKGE